MIVATPLDLPKIEPDNWNTFWDIWNKHSAPLIKVASNAKSSPLKVGSSGVWKGMDIYSSNNSFTAWRAPFIDISESLPALFNTIKMLPFENIFRVRLISSLIPVSSHTDDDLDVWSIRAYFHYTDTKDQWYVTKPNDVKGQRHYLHIPQSTNWFSYNDKFCWHGTDYNPLHPKILLQVYSLRQNDALITNSIKKYKDYTITL